jgi:hypothetical protein
MAMIKLFGKGFDTVFHSLLMEVRHHIDVVFPNGRG